VGSHLLAHLKKRGHEVVALVRPATLLKLKEIQADEVKEGNILDLNSIIRALSGCDAVINLVGIIRERKDITFRRLHVDATVNVIAACKVVNVRRYLHMSALGASPSSLASYHKSKFEAEKIIKDSGLVYTIFQPSIIIGKGSKFLTDMKRMMKRLKFIGLIGGGRYRLQPVSVNDVVDAFSLALEDERTKNETFQLCGPKIYTFKELILTMAKLWGIKIFTFPLPEKPMEIAARIFGRFSWFPITKDQLLMLKEESICSSSRFFALTWRTPERIEDILKLC